ncbi:MAG TPA: autotransporter-associated beta strand repeat-containing protein, partial [Lacipirellulaceae bacterium]|nr:autotransporter-associated beta strand repeat-containing protein [Lacipirellulaceae bacterium]
MVFAFRRCFVFAPILLALASIAQAQTDYFWMPPLGGNGTWDTSNFNLAWSDGGANGAPDYIWQNNGNERANFGGGTGGVAGTVTLGAPITAYGVNFATANYVINGGGNTLTLVGPGGVINSNVAATINAQIAGSVGLSKTGSGALTLGTANTYSGTTAVTGGTLLGVAQTSGSPFSSGPVTLNGAILQLKAVTASTSTTTNVGNLTIGAATAANVGASQLSVDNSLAGGSATTTFAAGNLIRGGTGSALVVTPAGGSLGGADMVTLSNGNSLLTNGILPPWVVTSNGTGPADYVTYGGAGITTTGYFSGDLTTSNNTSVVDQSSSPVIAGNVSAYALRNSATVDLATHTLTLGNGSGQSGLILNGGSITNGNISFGATEGVVFVQGTTTLGSAGNSISSNNLTITALGSSNTTINSNIVNGTAASQVTFTGATSGTSLTLNGANAYTGGTILSVNTGTTGNVFIGNNAAFGTDKVTNILVPGSSSDQLQASGGDRTLANAFDLNGGVTFTGTNSFTFNGPITIVNSLANGARTLQNSITTAGKTVTYGTAGSASTITIGNPVSNGGDGVGKNVIFSSNASSTTIINDVLQDPAAGGGTASGSVTYSGSAGGVVQLNSLNTYTGATFLNGGSTIQFNHDYNVGDPSGPFGVGTLTPNNSSNNVLQPVVGDRVIANPIALVTGFTVSNS